MSTKKITFKGEPIKYRTRAELAEKMKIDIKLAEEIEGRGAINRIIYNNGEIAKVNLRDKPLILRDFGLEKVSNKKLLEGKAKINGKEILKAIPQGKYLNLHLNVKISFDMSEDKDQIRTLPIEFKPDLTENIKLEEIQSYVRGAVYRYIETIGIVDNLEWEITPYGTYQKHKFRITQTKLRDETPLNLNNIWKNVEWNNIKDCAKEYLLKHLGGSKNMLTSEIKKLGDDKGITSEEIINFCKTYGIQIVVYDYMGVIISVHKPLGESLFVPMYFMAYNNHLYPINGRRPMKHKKDKSKLKKVFIENEYTINKRGIMKIKTDDDSKEIDYGKLKLIEFVDDDILPADIILGAEAFIKSFIVGDKKYINNVEYPTCLEVLELFGLEDYITDGITINNLFGIISRNYVFSNINSFFPNCNKFIKGGFNQQSNKKVKKSEISSIDKNKQYSFATTELPYLIVTDYRTNTITNKPNKIVDHNLYIVKPKRSTILIPDTNLYAGYHIKFAIQEHGKENFEIMQEMTAIRAPNYYKSMITDIYSKIKDKQLAKRICNIGIGKMEMGSSECKKKVITGIFTNDENDCHNGFNISLGNEYHMKYETVEDVSNIYNQKPISVQIKDWARMTIYKKMVSLGLTDNDIIQIRTDSITYIGKLPNDLDAHNLNGWKESKYVKLNNDTNIYNNHLSFDMINSTPFGGAIRMGLAGNGKSTDIINNIVPAILETCNKTDYIILTPSHASLKEFREAGLNCQVIQKYSLPNKVPKEQHIIIDEFGMCDKKAHNLLYKCALLGKEYDVYGDFNQLLPVGEMKHFNSEHYLKLMFSHNIPKNENFRNDFTPEYYFSIINEIEPFRLISEVKKYGTPDYKSALTVICYRTKTRDKYNKMILKDKGLTTFSKGVKLICVVNNKELMKMEIYNKFVVEILEGDENSDKFTITGDKIITKKQIEKCFRPAYAKTLYGVQGASLRSYYYAPEDYKFLDGRRAYTTISRLHTK